MPIQSGTHVGPYEILSAIGAGGMGEVYRARDPKLGRDVAIKVLPEAFAGDPARMARFQREAKVLASLSHPNIATIYGLEDSGGTRALVMELVEGPTLADRIKQGPIPVDEAIRIARQIADALEYAHERGIIHRDLKPANVKVTLDDAVKVLDFGLAKALEGDPASIDISTSPTISRMATMQGVLLGTAAYMSPEQAKAKPLDRRADIWAFGCVLYEMLTGKQAFTGETVTDTLASLIKDEPDWSRLPASTPMRVRVLLQRCLQKDPKQRLRDIGDARISLDEVLSGAPEGASSPSTAMPVWRRAIPWVAGILAVAVASVATWNLKSSPAPPAKPVTRFTITLPPGQRLIGLAQPTLALSPDGSRLAYVAGTETGRYQIYLRAMDSGETRPLPGTEGAVGPFFSPDGDWLGFAADAKLKKISVSGGVAQTLAETSASWRGASWGNHQAIVYAPGPVSMLSQIPDAGGARQELTRRGEGEIGHIWPAFLPGGDAVLYVAVIPAKLHARSLRTGEDRELLPGQSGTTPQYASSGHLIYAQGGNLMAVPFDPVKLETKGPPVQVLQGVQQISMTDAGAQYTLSASGSLAYVAGTLVGTQTRLVWVSRTGIEQPLAAPARYYNQPRLSPDGRRVAVDIAETDGTQQVALYDMDRDVLSRFTFDGSFNQYPVWTPDGKRIVFSSTRGGVLNLFWQRADGSGDLEQLENSTIVSVPFSWSPDGQRLAFVQASGNPSLWVLRMDSVSSGSVQNRKSEPFLKTSSFEDAPQFSPDGRWMAYASDESGRREIYVKPYPGPGGKWQVSTDGGTEPMWNRNGREIFYRTGAKMMAVDVNTENGFIAGKPRELFEDTYLPNPILNARPNYDVSADGQRFLMVKALDTEATAPTQINVVLNWTEELKRLVPTGK